MARPRALLIPSICDYLDLDPDLTPPAPRTPHGHVVFSRKRIFDERREPEPVAPLAPPPPAPVYYRRTKRPRGIDLGQAQSEAGISTTTTPVQAHGGHTIVVPAVNTEAIAALITSAGRINLVEGTHKCSVSLASMLSGISIDNRTASNSTSSLPAYGDTLTAVGDGDRNRSTAANPEPGPERKRKSTSNAQCRLMKRDPRLDMARSFSWSAGETARACHRSIPESSTCDGKITQLTKRLRSMRSAATLETPSSSPSAIVLSPYLSVKAQAPPSPVTLHARCTSHEQLVSSAQTFTELCGRGRRGSDSSVSSASDESRESTDIERFYEVSDWPPWALDTFRRQSTVATPGECVREAMRAEFQRQIQSLHSVAKISPEVDSTSILDHLEKQPLALSLQPALRMSAIGDGREGVLGVTAVAASPENLQDMGVMEMGDGWS